MISLNEKYVINEKGERISVLIDIKDYKKLLEALEELEAIRAYDKAKTSGDKAVPFEHAVKEIEKKYQ